MTLIEYKPFSRKTSACKIDRIIELHFDDSINFEVDRFILNILAIARRFDLKLKFQHPHFCKNSYSKIWIQILYLSVISMCQIENIVLDINILIFGLKKFTQNKPRTIGSSYMQLFHKCHE